MSLIKMLWDVCKYGLAGMVVGVLILILFGLIANAIAQEHVRPSTLGEQNRSLNYVSPNTIETVVYHEESYNMSSQLRCTQFNAKLTDMLKQIAEQIAQEPSVGYVYVGAITAINESWCRND